MKKHDLVPLVIFGSFLIFSLNATAWLLFDHNDGKDVQYIILVTCYVTPLLLLVAIIPKHKELTKSQKVKWLLYVSLTSFVGGFHFYLRYTKDVNQIASETDQRMKEGPQSLSEFDSRSNG